MVCGYFGSGKSTSKKTFPLSLRIFIYHRRFFFFFFFFRPNETELKRTEVNLSSYNRKKRMVSEFSIIGIELILLYKNLYTTL